MTVRYYSSSAGKMILQLGITAVATAIQVDTTAGLPGTTPFTLLIDAGQPTEEIVTVTQVSGNTLVVTRGEDGTSAQPHSNGAVVRHGISARDLRDSRDHENAVANVHGVTSAVVGVADAQALTNKNLSSGTNTFPSSLATDAELTAHTSLTAAHGATGAVVGTTNVQTLTNKTINGAVIGTPTFTTDLILGDLASTTARQIRFRRLAATGTNTYQMIGYVSSSDANGAGALVLEENAVEVNRVLLTRTGDLQVTTGDVLADNIPTTGVAATSPTKASKRLHWGSASGTTNASGKITITHGAGFSPATVTVTPQNTPYQVSYESANGTDFTVLFANAAGAALASTAVGFSYLLGE